MARVNEHYLKLKAGYLFPEIGRRVRAFAAANPSAKVIRLGIGDVTNRSALHALTRPSGPKREAARQPAKPRTGRIVRTQGDRPRGPVTSYRPTPR